MRFCWRLLLNHLSEPTASLKLRAARYETDWDSLRVSNLGRAKTRNELQSGVRGGRSSLKYLITPTKEVLSRGNAVLSFLLSVHPFCINFPWRFLDSIVGLWINPLTTFSASSSFSVMCIHFHCWNTATSVCLSVHILCRRRRTFSPVFCSCCCCLYFLPSFVMSL